MASSLSLLSAGQPRMLAYPCGTEVRTDMRLLEVDKHVLDELLAGRVVIKGSADEEAILCTSSKTFLLKYVETSNAQLLVAPEDASSMDADDMTDSTPVSLGAGAGLQTQYQQFGKAGKQPHVVVTATAGAHLELVEAAPRVACVESMLMQRPYDGAGAEASSDGSDMQAEEAGGSTRGLYTFEELLGAVQASPAELRAALRELGAVQLGRHWRLVEPAYMGGLLEVLLLTAAQEGLPLSALALGAICQALVQDGYDPRVTAHCVRLHGAPCAGHGAGASSQGRDASAPGPVDTDMDAGEDAEAAAGAGEQLWALSEHKVCLYFLRKALSHGRAWPLAELMAHWHAALPPGMAPDPAWLQGEVLHEGSSVRGFSRADMPKDPEKRFAALFGVRTRWDAADLAPYLLDMQGAPGASVEALLLKHTRASQPTPDGPITYTAR